MKARRNRNPFAYTAILLSALFVILIVFGIGMFYYVFSIPEPEGLSLASWPHTFTNDFSTWIEYDDGQTDVKALGLQRLEEYGLWVQILDESGREIFSYRKPDVYPEAYSMSELLALSESGYENGNTVFVSSCRISGTTLNYLVGYPYSIGKTMVYYNGENVVRLGPLVKRILPLAAGAAVIGGLVYSFWLSKKLSVLIGSIRKISQHSYEPVKEKGVFGEVYRSLNKMDRELRRSEKLQEETDRTRKEWISNITHDLKTPLSPIKGYAELLADGAVSDTGMVREYGSLILTAVFFSLPILQFQTYDQGGVLRGLEGIAFEKKQYAELSVTLTDEYIADSIREVQELFEDPENVGYDGNEQFLIGNAYWKEIAPRESLLNMIVRNYADPNVSVGYSAMTDLDVSNGTDFYQARQDKIEKILNDPSKDLSEEEKTYWQEMNSKVREPFRYGYYGGWEVLISAFELLMFPVLAVCIAVAPVFSGEYQAGTDAVILSGKYGKTRLAAAKLVAALLFGVLAFTLHVIVAFGISLAAFGIGGWDLPLQINGTTVPYPLTFLEGTLVNLGVIYLVLAAMIGLTLMLSARMKSPYLVLIVVVPVLFLPMFLSANGTAGIYNLFVFLTPYRSLMPNFGSYLSYQIGPVVLDAFTARAVLYGALALLLIPLAGNGFKKHQVA